MSRKVDKRTKKFIEPGEQVDNVHVTETWRGRVMILDKEKSAIAKRVGYKEDGEYAIKVR